MKNEKIKLGNGKWGIGNRYCCTKNNSTSELYSGTTKKLRSMPFALNLAPPFPILHSLFPILIYLLFVSCNLFTAPLQDDYFDKIDEEIAWANAAKLAVRLAYHSNWGSSTPVRGPISLVAGGGLDIRKSYDFSLEFTPAPAYSLSEWRVYPTAELPAGWEDDMGFLIPTNSLLT